jgi:hypothetical protein
VAEELSIDRKKVTNFLTKLATPPNTCCLTHT